MILFEMEVSSTPPAFVGNNYFCDTANQGCMLPDYNYDEDPQWDGAGCGLLNTIVPVLNPVTVPLKISMVHTKSKRGMLLCR